MFEYRLNPEFDAIVKQAHEMRAQEMRSSFAQFSVAVGQAFKSFKNLFVHARPA